MITAMEILVDNSGYPTEAIAKNSHDYRPLGLGYANLGALLMAFGLPYDSDAGRDFAATLTAIMCGEAYLQSARIAETCPPLASATPLTASVAHEGGACPGFYVNREPFLDVIRMHRAEVNNIGKSRTAGDKTFAVPQLDDLIAASKDCWDQALAHGEKHGYRNSQVTVLAPTGTIGFMMDCDTTGIEPDLALVKYKKLVGGGMIKIVNNTVPTALFKLGYNNDQVDAIVSYIDATGTIEGAPGVKPEHLAVFDCSFKPAKGTRSIHYMGHVSMMAATQPFLSGAISKTVNLPHDCTLDDIAEAYLESWRLGLKAVAVYRDGSKGAQPLNVSDGAKAKEIKGTSTEHCRRRRPHPRRHGLRPQARRGGSQVASKPRSPRRSKSRRSRSSPPPRPSTRRIATITARAAERRSVLGARTEPRPAPSATACPRSAPRSPTNSPSPATKATSPSASTPTASPAKSSSAWPKKAPPSPASWTPSPRPPRSPSSTACRSRCSARSSRTPASSPPAGPATSTSATPSPSWITSSAGSSSASSPASSSTCSQALMPRCPAECHPERRRSRREGPRVLGGSAQPHPRYGRPRLPEGGIAPELEAIH